MRFNTILRILKISILGFLVIALVSVTILLWAHVRLTNAQLEKVVQEQRFLARKMGELKVLHDKEMRTCENQVKFAVNGFRTGNYKAYEMIQTERRLNEGLQ